MENNFELSLKQTIACDLLEQPEIEEVLYGGAKGGGKIIGDEREILTPFGFIKGKNMKVGMLINNPDGTVQKIIQVKPKVTLPLWRVFFSDGTHTDVAEDHLWLAWKSTQTRKIKNIRTSGESSGEVVETKTLLDWINKGYKPQIPICEEQPFNRVSKEKNKIDPYLLGLLLGDGCFTKKHLLISCSEKDKKQYEEILGKYGLSEFNKDKQSIHFVGDRKKQIKSKLIFHKLDGLGSKYKFIPEIYKYGTINDRYSLVQGLMDTDGYKPKDKNGAYYYTISEKLANDMAFILRSLGAVVTITKDIGKYKKNNNEVICNEVFNLYIKHRDPDSLFRLLRKKTGRDRHSISKGIIKVEKTNEIITGRCISVSNPNGLYITDDFTVTHNSVFFCFAAIFYAQKIISLCGLKLGQYKYPPVIGFLGRKRGTDFNKTTLETWKKYIPSDYYTFNEQKKEICLFGLVRYHTGGLDDEENIRKFNSAEYGFIGIDQAEELDRDDAGMLRGTQGRTKINNITLPDKILFTANPAECFLEQDFFSDIIPSRRFVQALPSDNDFIDAAKYTNKLIEAWKHHPELIDAYVYGIWGGFKDGAFLFSRENCHICQNLVPEVVQYPRTVIVCDPAWLGDKVDEIVIYAIKESQIIDKIFLFNEKTTTTAAECVKMALQYGAQIIAIDSIGVGAGVVDNCELLLGENSSVRVMALNSASHKDIDNDFFNVRAAMTWDFSNLIAQHLFKLPLDPTLIDQLCAIKYEIKNGKIKIEDKEIIKSRLGSSPNRSDALIMGLRARKYCQMSVNMKDINFSVGRMLSEAQRAKHHNQLGVECVR